MSEQQGERRTRTAAVRIVVAVTVALAFSLGVYLILSSVQHVPALISFSFLLVLPAAVSAFIAYVADPFGERPLGFYLAVPAFVLVAVVVVGIVFLKEGVICVILLAPFWLASGTAGTWATHAIRRRLKGNTSYGFALLALPLLAMQAERAAPLPQPQTYTVSREIVVAATPEAIWPLLRGIPDVKPGEGRWNVSQDVLGIPRPLGAHLAGDGVGAERTGRWGQQIVFREVITQWRPDARIGWRFIFDDATWGFQDKHLKPNSSYFRVTEGGYSLEPLGANRTRLTLDTTYWVRTPVNAYSAAWGQLLMGDIENNLLALVKQRAEAKEGGAG